MIIPKKVKIGNYLYNVKFIDDTSIEKCGRSHIKKQQISINQSLSKELQSTTFLHEIIHQILDQRSWGEESNNEKLVDTLAEGFYQVLKDNHFAKMR